MATPSLKPTQGGQPIRVKVMSKEEMLEFRARVKDWTVIYPHYINKNNTFQEGRRVAAAEAVSNPGSDEITRAAIALGLKAEIEPFKGYPRDVLHRGRIRCLWWSPENSEKKKDDKGKEVWAKRELLNENVSSKKAMLKAICEQIQKERQSKPQPNTQSSNQSQSSSSSTASSKKNKKNKKKKH